MQSGSFAMNLFRGIRSRLFASGNKSSGDASLDWLTEKKLKHLPAGKLRSIRIKGKELFFMSPFEMLVTVREIFDEGIYQVNLPAKSYIIDCGANIGISTLYFKYSHPDAYVIAFEPDAKNFALLKKNIDAWGLSGVEVKEQAVWKENTRLRFHSNATMGSRFDDSGGGSTVEVAAVRLKDLLTRRVHFLKIDIEGAEYEVIRDIAEELKMVDHMFLEYHGKFSQNGELNHIFQILVEAGFSYYIREAAAVHPIPFSRRDLGQPYDIQLNIFCFREQVSTT